MSAADRTAGLTAVAFKKRVDDLEITGALSNCFDRTATGHRIVSECAVKEFPAVREIKCRIIRGIIFSRHPFNRYSGSPHIQDANAGLHFRCIRNQCFVPRKLHIPERDGWTGIRNINHHRSCIRQRPRSGHGVIKEFDIFHQHG